MNAESKVTAEHLKRDAYLYIRQSSLRQVLENTESTERQYALRRRAIALGWHQEQIIVIDHDQGHSGAFILEREGFQRLVADVGLGKAGIVMGLEVSRLARNCADWHRLLEICALSHSLILDEDGLYDPAHYNDRLLLGLKGTMSEAELHVLKTRLIGGMLNKAQRAELVIPLPIGLIYDEDQKVILDPDQQVQQAIRLFFATFERLGSAWATVQYFHQQGLSFPRRGRAGSGEVAWQQLTYNIALDTLHNPRYAGAFCFGRTRTWRDVAGKIHCQELPREQWRFLQKEVHPGYILWDQYLSNLQRLLDNHAGHGKPSGPPREGPALLQGLVVCGKCGRLMTVRYHQRGGQLTPDYVCQRRCVDHAEAVCTTIPGGGIDEAVGKLLVESLSPLALEVALNVQGEIQQRLDEARRLRQQQVQRAQYEADRARLRYMRVDPNHRLVADTLEAQWNEKLRVLAQTQEERSKQDRVDSAAITEEQKTKIRALASDLPKLWNDPKTADRERKRIVHLLLEDATLRREHETREALVQLRFRSGATRELHVPLPKPSWMLKQTKAEVISEIDRLLDTHTEEEIARQLNERGWCSGSGFAFSLRMVDRLRRDYHIKSRYQRLREKGLLTNEEVAQMIGGPANGVNHWRKAGVLIGVRFNEKGEYLFERPSPDVIAEIHRRRAIYAPKTKQTQTRSPSSPLGAV
jgi:DNA invertase Pin-like site-specific DNA recombinase